jgi:hypothetical protein
MSRESVVNAMDAKWSLKSTESVKSTTMSERPWQDLALDLLGPVPTGEHLIVLVDYYSRWIEVDVVRSTNSEK